ncbi:MAG: outer membrane lipid asymmetry maintenance protein MlaD, partial [SAR116 cluster bacterium]|nr:outer membrane lipid asymmetry maintenance protein MlaD [SAR116 cluster bacterium]
RITAASLLGGNYLELIPGADEDMMKPGEVIYDTRGPVSLTDLLGKAVFSAANDPS